MTDADLAVIRGAVATKRLPPPEWIARALALYLERVNYSMDDFTASKRANAIHGAIKRAFFEAARKGGGRIVDIAAVAGVGPTNISVMLDFEPKRANPLAEPLRRVAEAAVTEARAGS